MHDGAVGFVARYRVEGYVFEERDRKSTRLNSSHANISYAVFCLKKKKKKKYLKNFEMIKILQQTINITTDITTSQTTTNRLCVTRTRTTTYSQHHSN